MNKQSLKNLIINNLKKLSRSLVITITITLAVIATVYVYASFVEPTATPANSDQDFVQNIIGANNADNDYDSSLVTANSTGSVVEQLEFLTEGLNTTECDESTTATQTACYVDDTARYLTTDLCDETKENSCFIPTDNSYYAFGEECSDSTTTAKTNCYIDDTAKYVDTNACSNASSDGYCYVNTATFPDLDADLTVANIANGVTILGVSGTLASAQSNPAYQNLIHIAAFTEPVAGPTDSDQDFSKKILGANNADNDFDSSSASSNNDGSIIERLKYLIGRKASDARFFATECDDSTTTATTTCYVDDTARYLTTDLCDETKENSCFVPTDNSYYAFGEECSDSTTTAKTNCYIDDTAKYVDTNACSNASSDGYCYVNTATFPDLDADLTAANIKYGVTILGVTGTKTLTNGSACSIVDECTSGFCADGVCCDTACTGSTCQRCDAYSVSGAGTCGYVSSSAEDPDDECAQGSLSSDGCIDSTCSGSDYTCKAQSSGDGGCPVCGRCTDSDIACEYHPANTYDSGCSACYTCSGSEIGTCTNVVSIGDSCGGGIKFATGLVATPGHCTDSATPVCDGTTDSLTKQWAVSTGTDEPADSTTNGESNTNALISPAPANPAALFCYTMVYGGYSDWYLPAKDQLGTLDGQRVTVGDFVSYHYWSSTEYSTSDGWTQYFGNVQAHGPKTSAYYIRCIRSY